MEGLTINGRAVAGARAAIGLGMIGGAIEAVVVASRESLPLGWLGFVVVGVLVALVMGVVTGAFGAVIALPTHFVLRNRRPSSAIAIHLALVAFFLIGFYLWQAAWLVYTDERAPGAFALAAMPIGFAGVLFFNARFLLRRVEIGKPLGWPWLPSSAVITVGFVALAATLYTFRDTGGTHALPDDQNFLLVTVEHWDGPPQLEGGTVFEQAVTPSPLPRAAAAALNTGIHPLRTQIIEPTDVLAWNYRTLAEVLVVEGYATGAFVGSPSLSSDSGLSQGFLVYDDEMSPVVPGLLRFNLPSHLLGWAREPRDDAQVLASFETWLAGKRELPFFAWVHLQKPPPPGFFDQLEGIEDETLVVLTALAGDDLAGVAESTVRVPFAMRAPKSPHEQPITAQIRLMDVMATATDFLGMEGPTTEGVELIGYLTGKRSATMGCTVVGEQDGKPVLAVRNNGMKLIELADDAYRLYDVDKDPDEQDDLSTKAPDTLEQAKRLLAPDSIRLQKLLKGR